MKKVIVVLVAILLSANFSFAQSARNASPVTISHAGRTNFANIGVTGLDVAGNPGYIALSNAASDPNNFQTEYYLWVNPSGSLCIASYGFLQAYASFPTGSWKDTIACPRVGAQ